ncbi:hypothetical protein ES332_A11G142500v1 [Gossypium tomentosum]|uniref:Uncharacterized protein n=1 Tax=Gossypium tomentosum TaxID=34277 RepID=A0A5D2N997_GOSTO|nr:hypothetical protein ES332_A11G142500v1 [Gossypium tomentosum]
MVYATRLVAIFVNLFLDEKWRHLFYGLGLQRGSVPRKQCMTCEFLSFGQGKFFSDICGISLRGGKKLFKFSEMIEVHKNIRIK